MSPFFCWLSILSILHCRISFPWYFPFYLSSNSWPTVIIPPPQTEMKLQRELCSIRKQEIYLSICCVCVSVVWVRGDVCPPVCVQRPGGSRGCSPIALCLYLWGKVFPWTVFSIRLEDGERQWSFCLLFIPRAAVIGLCQDARLVSWVQESELWSSWLRSKHS